MGCWATSILPRHKQAVHRRRKSQELAEALIYISLRYTRGG